MDSGRGTGGVQAPELKEHTIKSVDDYSVVEYFLEHTAYLPDYGLLEEIVREFGDERLPIGDAAWTAIHTVVMTYIGYGNCLYHMVDHPQEFERLLQVMREPT